MHDHHHAPGDKTAGMGHNAKPAAQWQTPHLPPGHHHHPEPDPEPDLDLVEAAFIEGFETASDPTSFLRLTGIPFKSRLNGQTLDLIRVDLQSRTDIASITPLLGGQGHRVAPLPKNLVGKRRTLHFTYLTETGSVNLTLAQARALDDLTPAR